MWNVDEFTFTINPTTTWAICFVFRRFLGNEVWSWSLIQEHQTFSILKNDLYWFGVSLCEMLFYILNIVINGYSYVMTWKAGRYL